MIIRIRGRRALWGIPHLRAEPFTYPVPTRDGIAGTLSSIYRKPEMSWAISKIEVLSPISLVTVMHNEVSDYAPSNGRPLIVNIKKRAQRLYTYLVDVDYAVYVHIDASDPRKHYEVMERRLRKGQQYRQPYLGVSQCPVDRIELVEDRSTLPPPIDETRDLGLMLWGRDWADPQHPVALYFAARLNRGIVDIPPMPATLRLVT